MHSDSNGPKDACILFSGVIKLFGSGHDLSVRLQELGQSHRKNIHLAINSRGGSSTSGEILHDNIFTLLDKKINVCTYNTGRVDSAALSPYVAGKERYCDPRGTFLLHETLLKPGEKREDILPLIEACSQLIADATGIDVGKIRDLRKKNTRLNAREALELGLVHDIRTFEPSLDTDVFRMEYPDTGEMSVLF